MPYPVKQISLLMILFMVFIIPACGDTGFSGKAMSSAPYKKSNIIGSVEFSPVRDIVLAAKGSDNWPITWGAGDELYTAYGDGKGFIPYTENKLSLGLAVIIGGPFDFKGKNLRSMTGEAYGDGKKGLKASGMLMLDKSLYMLVRNIDGQGNYSQLMWSNDSGKKWQKAFDLDKNFGCPVFLNYGPDYANARDEYVYIYSHKGPSSYKSYDHIVLARVHKTKILDINAHEFYSQGNNNDKPFWTKKSKNLEPVFSFPGHCARMEVIYNAGMEKYLIILSYNGKSGWGIFEAENPWGPWSTIYHTEQWDVPGVHGLRMPTKWISDNGMEAMLIFSGSYKYGYDAFCVRKIKFIGKPDE